MIKMVIEIGHRSYAMEPRDAIVLLDIASRAIAVETGTYREPYRQAENQDPFVSSASLVEYEPLALPQEEPAF